MENSNGSTYNENAFLINGIPISRNPYDHTLVALYSSNHTPELEGQLEAYGVFPFNSSRKQRKAVIAAYSIFLERRSEARAISRDTPYDEISDKGKSR